MSDVNPKPLSAAANVVLLQGRIHSVQRHEGKHYTEVVVPARDEYSFPGRVKVESGDLLGRPGDDVSVRCGLAGSVRTFIRKDGETGRDIKTWLVAL